jgi:hypothetical protein
MSRKLCRLAVVAFLLALARPLTAAQTPEPGNDIPNVVGEVSQRLLDHFLQMNVDKQIMFTDNVLGTSVRGAVHTRGRVASVLVPDTQMGAIELRFTGTTNSPRMVGTNGPATIHSSSSSNFTARKLIRLDELGLHLLPTVAQANTKVSINDVVASRRIVERIARRRVKQSQEDARAITSQRTQSRLQQEVDRDAAAPLAQAQDYFMNSFRQPLLERQSLPKLFQFSTTHTNLRVMLQQCSRSQSAPPKLVPAMDPRHDIVVALHESSICSIYEIFFAGQRAIDRDVLHTVQLLTGEVPRPLRVHARTPPWSIMWADRQPLALSFADNQAAFTVRLKSLQNGERNFEGAFAISVRYAIQNVDGAPRLARVGDVEMEGTTANGSAAELAEALGILRAKFSAVFQPSFAFEGLVPPTGGVWGKLRMLELTQLEAQDGWLVVGYQLPRPATLAANASRNK